MATMFEASYKTAATYVVPKKRQFLMTFNNTNRPADRFSIVGIPRAARRLPLIIFDGRCS